MFKGKDKVCKTDHAAGDVKANTAVSTDVLKSLILQQTHGAFALSGVSMRPASPNGVFSLFFTFHAAKLHVSGRVFLFLHYHFPRRLTLETLFPNQHPMRFSYPDVFISVCTLYHILLPMCIQQDFLSMPARK